MRIAVRSSKKRGEVERQSTRYLRREGFLDAKRLHVYKLLQVNMVLMRNAMYGRRRMYEQPRYE